MPKKISEEQNGVNSTFKIPQKNINYDDTAEKNTSKNNDLIDTEPYEKPISYSYAPYGNRDKKTKSTSLAYKGEHLHFDIGLYLLGKGYRAYYPALMRFISADSWSPFGKGGINSYSYCTGDPINKIDPSGHVGVRKALNRRPSTSATTAKKISETKYTKNQATPHAGSGPRRLENHQTHNLAGEWDTFNKRPDPSTDPRRFVKTALDLSAQGIGTEQKFLINHSREMVITTSGAKGGARYVSHGVLVDLLKDKRIISAGTLFISSLGEVALYARSGHYRPTLFDLRPAVHRLRNLGYDVDTIDIGL